MATPIAPDIGVSSMSPSAGGIGFGGLGDGALAATGFGPGTILIAVIGGVLTLIGAITHRLGRNRTALAVAAPTGLVGQPDRHSSADF